MDSWYKDYKENSEEYLELFNRTMNTKQEQNVEFLEKNIAYHTNRNYAVAVSNGTDALLFALICSGIKPGDEVLVSNFSWISTASCISMIGAIPVFCDIDISSYHMSLDSVKKMYSDKTKAIIYPHLFGNMSDTSRIQEFCQEIPFIEDACQALGSSLNNVKAGEAGDISTLSFNANKVIAGIAGGGALLTDDDRVADTAKKLRRHGNHEMLGYNSKMLFMNAVFINHRLKKIEEYQTKRQEVAKKYNEHLKDLVIIQDPNDNLDHNYHKYIIRLQSKETRDRLKVRLGANIHYDTPISELPMYKNIEHRKDDITNTQTVCDTILTLPIDPFLRDEEIENTCNIIMATV
jgi:dTDP-4-amino-4,6-dideoxygalactose transaminase